MTEKRNPEKGAVTIALAVVLTALFTGFAGMKALKTMKSDQVISANPFSTHSVRHGQRK